MPRLKKGTERDYSTEDKMRRAISSPDDGFICLIGRIIRDGYKNDPYWFFSPSANFWCDVGGLVDIPRMYRLSLARNPHIKPLPFRQLDWDDYLDFRTKEIKARKPNRVNWNRPVHEVISTHCK
jgi:hypothetical protein